MPLRFRWMLAMGLVGFSACTESPSSPVPAAPPETLNPPPSSDPLSSQVLQELGDAALYSGLHEEALHYFERAMAQNPTQMSPLLGAIRSSHMGGKASLKSTYVARVKARIAEFEEVEQNQGRAWLLKARLHLALDQSGEALDAALLAISHLSERGVAWRVLGEAALAAERWQDGAEAFEKALELGLEAQPGTWEKLADAYDELGEYPQAERAARKALELTGEDLNAKRRRLNLLATILKHRRDLTGAEETLQEAMTLGKEDPAVLHNLGALAEARQTPEQARTFYERAITLNPLPTTLLRLGRIQLELNQPDQALHSFQRAAGTLDRWNWPASQRWMPAWEVGRLYARNKRWKEARGWFEDALREARTAEAMREIQGWLGYVNSAHAFVEDAQAQPLSP